MNRNNVEQEVQYDNLYSFVSKSESKQDFIERLQIISATIVSELATRINEKNPQFAFQVTPIIDKMNEEVCSLVENINTTKFVEGQSEVMQPLLLRLIAVNNPKLYVDYVYSKTAMVN